MSSRKRKRYFRDVQCVFFPDDVNNGFQKAGREPASLSSASASKSWEKCGDSFVDTAVIQNLKSSGRRLPAVRKLAQSPAFAHTSAAGRNEAPVHIAWSSSDSDESGDESCRRRPTALTQSYTRELHMLSANKGELPVIDTDSDLDESEEDGEKDSGQQISDCDSESIDEKKDSLPEPTDVTELEISGYVSDGEDICDTMTPRRLDSESFPLQTGEGSRRSVSDWVRSAQALLQTPRKALDGQSKSPEDSARKRRKFQSGGLAERLNRLQRRQRAAVGFWRHQAVPDASTTTAVRPGALVLEVLEVRDECGMQMARCERRRQPPGEGGDPDPEGRAPVLVLFNRETAAQLTPAPGDIVHVCPPWQRLSTEGFGWDVILNTHFSQKVLSASKPADVPVSRGLRWAERCTPYHLGRIFALQEVCGAAGEDDAKQVAVLSTLSSFGAPARHCLSLLEAIEGLGQAGSVGQDVEVVVQRVFSVPAPDCSAVSVLRPRAPSVSSSAPPPAEKGKTRLCILVQDGYGMFSVVQLQPLPRDDDLRLYRQRWQGKTCALSGVKVVRRVTRERRSRLFSLIDSLWPPVMPLREHGEAPSVSSESRPAGPAPSFCYLLSGQESSVEPAGGQAASPLYLPPAARTLRDILQSDMKTCRCSFVATVIYKRMQSSDVGQGEVWLVLTDPSLQEERRSERPCRRTVALCVSTSCVLTSSVLEALRSPAACRVSFSDAIKEHGVLLCAEQSVVEMCSVEPEGSLRATSRPEILSKSLSEPQTKTLPQPVRLDPLSPETTPNSICTLTGVIVGVDENTAYSWPACSDCGSDNLEVLAEKPQNFHCVSCKSWVAKPNTKIQLEVYLRSSSLSDCTLKVKLQKKTIMSVLNTVALESNEFPGYDVENVLGKEVGPLNVYVRVVTRKPAPWIGLEEISL